MFASDIMSIWRDQHKVLLHAGLIGEHFSEELFAMSYETSLRSMIRQDCISIQSGRRCEVDVASEDTGTSRRFECEV